MTDPEPYDLDVLPTFDPLKPFPNQIVMVMAAWIPDHGWLVTRRGMIYGGKHGQPPLLDLPWDELKEIVAREATSSARAIQHRYQKTKEGE